MRRTILTALTFVSFLCSPFVLKAQTNEEIVASLNKYGTFDQWTVREVKESGLIGGATKYLYEFYGNPSDTLRGNKPYKAPEGYLWRTNNVMANVVGVVKANITDFPEKREDGYCIRIETHIEEVKALGIVNMDVTCQGAFLFGELPEPIRDTKNPMEKPNYGMPFSGKPKALVYDYKADVGYEVIRGTGFSKLKNMGYPDYPIVLAILQKRWEDEKGGLHALRVGTGIRVIKENAPEWVDGYVQEIHYGDITGEPFYTEDMGLISGEKTLTGFNSKGKKAKVVEEGWADKDETPNFMVIYFLSSCGEAFYGGVGNTLWLDNVRLEM